ncbi:MAG: ammonium transporter [Flavobacteriaceae bacterium TMED42]|nr:MAG: ammonium transporter [Flavobacteriaceae bacterium TMED42]
MEEYTQILNEQTFAINTVWVALCAALIFFMEAGFALLEAGFVRAKNAMSIVAKVIIDITFGGIAFFVVGFGIAYGASNGWVALDFGITERDLGLGLKVSNQLFWFIQLGFAVAAISIVSGALAERMKLWAYAILVVFFCGIMYPLVANWVWNPNGWLALRGFNDFAGSAAVHAMGGFSALAAAIVLGPRIGKYSKEGNSNTIPGHNLPLASVGAFILWFGWFGFNPGSSLGAVGNWELIGSVVVNTFLASAAGGIATMFYTFFSYGKIDITMVINGILAGLVSITAGCNVVGPMSAILIGFIAGILVDVAVLFFDKMKVDDPVGAVAVHGINGLFGTLAVGFFAIEGGLFFGGGLDLLTTQLIGVTIIALFSFSITFIIMKVLKSTVGIRITTEEEEAGIDSVSFGVKSYSNE